MRKVLLLTCTLWMLYSMMMAQQPIEQLNKWAAQQTGDIGAGEVVEFLNGGRAAGDITFGIKYEFNSTWSVYCSAITIDASHFIIAYGDGSTQRGKATVCTVSGNVITYGPKYTFNNGITEYISASMLDPSHFVIVYRDDGNSNYGTSIIGTIYGNYISFGSEYIFNSAWNTQLLSVTALDATHFVVAYQDSGNSYYGTSIIGTVSGTTISYGSEYIFNYGWTESCSAITVDSEHFIIGYRDKSNSNYGTAIMGIVSGNNITFGTEEIFNYGSTEYISATCIDPSHFVVAYNDQSNSNYGTAVLGSISSNQITFGSEFIFSHESTYSLSTTNLDSVHFVLTYRKEWGNSVHGKAIVGSISGNNILFGTESIFVAASAYFNSVTSLDNSRFAVAFERPTSGGWIGMAVVGTVEGDPLSTTAPSQTTCPGTVTTPITVQNAEDVTEVFLILNYGNTNLTYTGYQNVNPQLASGAINVADLNGEITIAWNSTTAANITTGTLLELQFTATASYTQNIENLTWDETNSYYEDSNGDFLSTVFNNGQVTIEPMTDGAGTITGSNNICQGANSESYQVGSIANATSYIWELDPTNSGTINGSGTNITIDYSATFSGQTTLAVYGTNSCGNGSPSSVIITVNPSPTANANVDATVCENNTYSLSGSATNQQSILWSTAGDGTFDDATSLSAVYTPGNNDISSGSVTLNLTAYAIAPCATNAFDDMVLTIQPLPTVNSGLNDTIADNATYTLAGSASNEQSILWTTAGDGTFDDATLFAATYTPGTNDIAVGSVILTLTAYSIAPCATNIDDNMTLTIQPSQQINLLSGWNIASYYVAPFNMDLLNILQPLVTSNELTKVIDEQGNFIQEIPGFGWLNTVGNMQNTEGYYIKITQNAQLDLFGSQVITPFEIPLSTGWNIMGYPTKDTTNAIAVLQPLIDSSYLTKVIDEAGGFIQEIPGFGWLNTIGDFEPGEGYYIKVNQNCTLTIGREAPTVTTDNATGITHSSATSGGNVTYSGGVPVTARGVCWSTSSNPTLTDSYTTDGSGEGAFVSNITGLTANTQYYVRAYATNAEGTGYGNEVGFTTSPPTLATVTTNAITNITANTATSGGNVISNGGATVTARGVCWSTSSNPTIADSFTTDGSGTGSFISNLTGLVENSTYYVRAYASNSEGTAYGNEVFFVAILPPFTCGELLTYEGQSYTTVQIGTQCWMAENLNVGTMVTGSQTNNSQIEKYCYNNNLANCDTYGGLYQWNEMMQYVSTEGVQGICPAGWHLPADNEWKTMEIELGMTQAQADADGFRGTNQGSQLKSTNGWYDNGNGINSSGFTALPGGYRYSNGSFLYLGSYGYWWSSSESSGFNAWMRSLLYSSEEVYRYGYYKVFGHSVRCLKD